MAAAGAPGVAGFPLMVNFINDGQEVVLEIPGHLMTFQAVLNVGCNYQVMVEEKINIFYDFLNTSYRLTTMDPALADATRFRLVAELAPGNDYRYIPRPPNAWILYRSAKSREIRAHSPHLTAGQISSIAAQMWKAEPSEVRHHFANLAAGELAEHQALYPDYKYRPGSN